MKSSPILRNPGGRAVLDMQIERNEQRDYHEDYFRGRTGRRTRMGNRGEGGEGGDDNNAERRDSDASGMSDSPGHDDAFSPKGAEEYEGQDRNGHSRHTFSPEPPDAPDSHSFGELYIFSYGVMVFWNFTERQEKVGTLFGSCDN